MTLGYLYESVGVPLVRVSESANKIEGRLADIGLLQKKFFEDYQETNVTHCQGTRILRHSISTSLLLTWVIQLSRECLSYFLIMSFHGSFLKSSLGTFRASARMLESVVRSRGSVMLNRSKIGFMIGSSGLLARY